MILRLLKTFLDRGPLLNRRTSNTVLARCRLDLTGIAQSLEACCQHLIIRASSWTKPSQHSSASNSMPCEIRKLDTRASCSPHVGAHPEQPVGQRRWTRSEPCRRFEESDTLKPCPETHCHGLACSRVPQDEIKGFQVKIPASTTPFHTTNLALHKASSTAEQPNTMQGAPRTVV